MKIKPVVQQAPIGLIALAFLAGNVAPVSAQVRMPGAPAPSDLKPPPGSEARPAPLPGEGIVVRDVRVEGLQRIEPGTIFSYLPIRVGDRVSEKVVTESVRSLFATGFFKDVRVELDRDVLVVIVEERPAIGAIEIRGAKEFDQEVLKKALADTGLAEARIFDRALLERAEQELKRQYLGRGKYDVQIQSTITPLERNRVAISMAIDEGEDARIAEIRIVGAKTFTEDDLLDEFQLSARTWMSWYTKSDQYSRQKLTADIETLRAFYLNRGFLEYRLDSTLVSLSSDRKQVFITLVIDEGDLFTLGSVELGGDLLGQEDGLKRLINLRPGEIYSNKKLLEVTKAITDRLGELGFAFASVNPVPRLNRGAKVVDFSLQVDPGRRVYVRRVNISGNAKTRDEVIRREVRQYESSWYDSERIRLSKNRIDRLGFFKQVEAETEPVAGASDQVDLNLKVEERALGNVMLGLGYNSSESLVLTASLSQQNFLGSGKSVSLGVNTSEVNKLFSVNHFDPYWSDDGVSLSTEAYQKTFSARELDSLGNYTVYSAGVSGKFGIPYSETNRYLLGLGYESSRLRGSAPNTNWRRFGEDYPSGANAYLLYLGLVTDSRNSALAPTRGQLSSLAVDYATPISDIEYARLVYEYQQFFEITNKLTYAFRLDSGVGVGLNGSVYPAIKSFYVGGIGSVRGFAAASIGPRSDGLSVGGSRKLVLNNEILAPLPGMAQDRTIRAFAYLDAGSAWEAGDSFSQQPLRVSAGVGLSWISPVGPLKFSIGQAIRKLATDETERIQFQIGTGF